MNPVQRKLADHAAKGGRAWIEAQVADMNAIYLEARARIERHIVDYVQRGGNSFAGPRLVSLMEQIQTLFSDFESSYRERAKYAIHYLAQGYYREALATLMKDQGAITGQLSQSWIDSALEDSYTSIAGATRKMSDYAVGQLRNISARVMREAALTGETRRAVSARLLGANNAGGMFKFIDAAGRSWRNDAYFDMLGRTMLLNHSRDAYLQGCADSGSDIVKVSVSGKPCPACAQWEGRLLSISGKHPDYPSLQSAVASGLFHPNCTHRVVAVPEIIAKRKYDAGGRPLSGLNSAGNEERNDPEAWKAYRKEGGISAYTKKRASWKQDIVNAGGTPQIADQLEKLYTPKIAKLGDPPKVVFHSQQTPYYDNANKLILLNQRGHHAHAGVARHEFGHWWHYRIREKYPDFDTAVKDAAKQDYQRLLSDYKDMRHLLKMNMDGADHFSNKWFSKRYLDLTAAEKNTIHNFYDSLGSISNGAYGGGHATRGKYGNYYKNQNARLPHGEAVAEIFDELFSGSDKFKVAFPDLYDIIKQKLKGNPV